MSIFAFITGMTKSKPQQPNPSSAPVEDNSKKTAPLLPGAEEMRLKTALQFNNGNKNPLRLQNVSCRTPLPLSWWLGSQVVTVSTTSWGQVPLLTQLSLCPWGKMGWKEACMFHEIFWLWPSPLWGRMHLLGDRTALEMHCLVLIQQRSHSREKIPL